ncbi:hypothetical protein ACWGIU_01795 [Streptomyces sp. NPDC054840]
MQLRRMLVAAAVMCLPFASVSASAYAATSVPADVASNVPVSEIDPDVQAALSQLIASAMGAEGLPELSDEISGLEAAIRAWASDLTPDVPELPAMPGVTPNSHPAVSPATQ